VTNLNSQLVLRRLVTFLAHRMALFVIQPTHGILVTTRLDKEDSQ
jgi:hypothetical protein